MRNVTILCVAFWIGLITGAFSQSCKRADRKQCTKTLDNYFKGSHNSVYPNFDDTTLDIICAESLKANTCLRKLEKSCTATVRRHMDGQEAAYEYICGQGNIVYKEIRECLQTPDLLDKAATCNNTYQEDLNQLSSEAYYKSLEEISEEQCKLTNIYLWCLKGAVKKYCGGRASFWQHKVNTLVLTPLMDGMDCEISEPFPLNKIEVTLIVVGIAIGIALIVSLIVTIIFCIQRKRALGQLEEQKGFSDKMETGETADEEKKLPLEFTNDAMLPPGDQPKNNQQTGHLKNIQNDHAISRGGRNIPDKPRVHKPKSRQSTDGSLESSLASEKPPKHRGSKHRHPRGSRVSMEYDDKRSSLNSTEGILRHSQHSTDGSLKSSLRSTERSLASGRKSGRSVTVDESINQSLPEYDIVTRPY